MAFDHDALRRRVTAKRRALGLADPADTRREPPPRVQVRPPSTGPAGRRPEHRVRRLYRTPLIGRLIRIVAALYNMPVILQNLERHYADTAASLSSADQGRAAAQARIERLEQTIAALAEARRVERERLEQSVAALADELRVQRDRFERRLGTLTLKATLLAEVAGAVKDAESDVEQVRDVDSRIVELLSEVKPEAVLAIEADGRPAATRARRTLAEAVVLRGGLETLAHSELSRVFSASALLKDGGFLILQGLGRDLAGDPVDTTVVSLSARRAGLRLQAVIEGEEGGAFALVLRRFKRTRSAA